MRYCILSVFLLQICVISFLGDFRHVTGEPLPQLTVDFLIEKLIAPILKIISNEDALATRFKPTSSGRQGSTVSTRSTPEPLPTGKTDVLRFWSGEALKFESKKQGQEVKNLTSGEALKFKSTKQGHEVGNLTSGEALKFKSRKQGQEIRNLTAEESKSKSEKLKQKLQKTNTTVFRSYDTADEERRSLEQWEKQVSQKLAKQEKKPQNNRGRITKDHHVESPDDTVENTKINGYTLVQEIRKLFKDYDENITISSIAKTLEHHDIVLVKMGKAPKYFRAYADKYEDEEPEKKIILIVHGLSASGFRTVPCLYRRQSFMRLVDIYTSFLDKFNIFLIPMANPDGIADDTLLQWNKNKSPQKACSGVALDRNFDVEWVGEKDSCSQQYEGPKPFSELESRAVGDIIHHYSHKIAAYVHVHAASHGPDVYRGDVVLFPRGHIDQPEDDKYADMEADFDEALKTAGFKHFNVAMYSLYSWYGKVTGSSVDYATRIYGIPYAMEFLMQPYDIANEKNISDEVSDNVLTEVWKRVMTVIFNQIYKTTAPSSGSSSSHQAD